MSKILVIDDESWLREMIRLALEQQGFEVIEAFDSADGINKARQFLPDLILCDVNMDKQGSGYTTLETARERRHRRHSVHPDDRHGRFRRHAARHGTRRGRLPAQAVQGGRTLRRRERAAAQGQDRPRGRRAQTHHAAHAHLDDDAARAAHAAQRHHRQRRTARHLRRHLGTATITEMGKEICKSGLRLERLIENFLFYARLEMVATDADSVIALRSARLTAPASTVRATAIAQAEIAGRPADLTLDLTNAPLAMAEDYFKKIVAELVQNAFKFSEAGSTVNVSLKTAGEEIEFSVRDHGRGLSTEHIRHIDAYVQFERKMQDEQGLGLGLAIAKKLAELHGGRSPSPAARKPAPPSPSETAQGRKIS
jgi:two-component system sensor histidine kinase/response regulator